MSEIEKWNRNRLKCFNCIFFEGKEDATGFIQVGRCIRNAPTIRGFPIMLPNQYCGEHRLDENKFVIQETEIEPDYQYVEDVEDVEEYVEPEPYIRKGVLPMIDTEREKFIDEMFNAGMEKVIEVEEEKQKKI